MAKLVKMQSFIRKKRKKMSLTARNIMVNLVNMQSFIGIRAKSQKYRMLGTMGTC